MTARTTPTPSRLSLSLSTKFGKGEDGSAYLFDPDIYTDGRISVQGIDGVLFPLDESETPKAAPAAVKKVVTKPRRRGKLLEVACTMLGSFGQFSTCQYLLEYLTNENDFAVWVCVFFWSEILQPEEATVIEMKESVSLTFALRYMNSFTKATTLANQVTISLSSDLPVVVEYKIAEMDYIRFYLAPRPQKEVKPKAETKPKAGTKPKVETNPKVEIKPEEESKTYELSMVPVDITPKDEAEIMDVED